MNSNAFRPPQSEKITTAPLCCGATAAANCGLKSPLNASKGCCNLVRRSVSDKTELGDWKLLNYPFFSRVDEFPPTTSNAVEIDFTSILCSNKK